MNNIGRQQVNVKRHPVFVTGLVNRRLDLLMSMMEGTKQGFVNQATNDKIDTILRDHPEWAKVFKAAGL